MRIMRNSTIVYTSISLFARDEVTTTFISSRWSRYGKFCHLINNRSTTRDGRNLEAQPAVNQRRGGSSSKPNSQAFTGRSCELHDWMEDARNRLPSVPSAERLPFLIAHLEGPAREEVRYAPETEKDSVDKIFILLLSTFGETLTKERVVREKADKQRKCQGIIPGLVRNIEDISNAMQSKDEMLIEVFCENLIDIHIKREMKRLIRSQTTISFIALRSEAIRLEEDGMCNSYQNACVRGIQEPHKTPGDSSPLDRIAAQLELFATTQSEIVSLLRSQQQAPVGVVNPDRPEPRSGGVVYCEYCNRRVTPPRGAGSALVTGGVMGNNQQIASTGVIRMIAQRLKRCRVAR